MALMEIDFKSQALGYHEEIMVTLPDVNGVFPVLWLLHDAFADCSQWMRQTSVERYASKRGIAVVMPTLSDSCGMDMVPGMKYLTMLCEELPAALGYILPCLDMGRSCTAGAGMGGYAAWMMALLYPEHFPAAGAFSGIFDIAREIRSAEGNARLSRAYSNAFGNTADLKKSNADLFELGRSCVSKGKCPRLWSLTGSNDHRALEIADDISRMRSIGISVTEYTGEPGTGFDLWDKGIEPFLDWFLQRPEKGEQA